AGNGMPERTPNARASYDAVATTCRGRLGFPSPPTTTGRPASSGRRRTSTAARNWSRSTWRTQGDPVPTTRSARYARSVGRDEVEHHDEVRRRRELQIRVARFAEGVGERDVDLAATADLHPLDRLLQTRWQLTRAGNERQWRALLPRRIEQRAVG